MCIISERLLSPSLLLKTAPSFFVLETLYLPYSMQIQTRSNKYLLSAISVPGIGPGAEDTARDKTVIQMEPTSQYTTTFSTVGLCSFTGVVTLSLKALVKCGFSAR